MDDQDFRRESEREGLDRLRPCGGDNLCISYFLSSILFFLSFIFSTSVVKPIGANLGHT